MKVLKVLLIIVAIVVAAVLVVGLIAPKEFSMSRDIEINAPKEVVWKGISSLETQHEWSPWSAKDPNMTFDFKGDPGTVGSVYHWAGNEEVGEGEQEITSIEPMSKVEQDLRFTSPYESQADVTFSMEDSENGQKVTWAFTTEFGFMASIFMMMGDMEAMLAPDFEKGLANLKEMCESAPSEPVEDEGPVVEVDGQMIAEKEFGPKYYVGIRQVVEWKDMQKFFADNFSKASSAINDGGFVMTGPPSALYFNWDEENQKADMAAVIPVDGDGVIIDGFENFNIEPSMSYQIDYYGPYEGIGKGHEALNSHMNTQDMDLSQGMVIEEYVTDPMTETDQSKWLTRIVYPIGPKAGDE